VLPKAVNGANLGWGQADKREENGGAEVGKRSNTMGQRDGAEKGKQGEGRYMVARLRQVMPKGAELPRVVGVGEVQRMATMVARYRGKERRQRTEIWVLNTSGESESPRWVLVHALVKNRMAYVYCTEAVVRSATRQAALELVMAGWETKVVSRGTRHLWQEGTGVDCMIDWVTQWGRCQDKDRWMPAMEEEWEGEWKGKANTEELRRSGTDMAPEKGGLTYAEVLKAGIGREKRGRMQGKEGGHEQVGTTQKDKGDSRGMQKGCEKVRSQNPGKRAPCSEVQRKLPNCSRVGRRRILQGKLVEGRKEGKEAKKKGTSTHEGIGEQGTRLGMSRKQDGGRNAIIVRSQNIQGGLVGKKYAIAEVMEESQVDVLMVQEARIAEANAERIPEMKGYKHFAALNPKKAVNGCVTWIHARLACLVKTERIIKDTVDGRYIAIPMRTLRKGQDIWWINIYAPVHAKDKPDFWQQKIRGMLAKVRSEMGPCDKMVVGMDANIVRNEELDVKWEVWEEEKRAQYKRGLAREAMLMQGLMDEFQLGDVWRSLHLESREYTREEVRTEEVEEEAMREENRHVAPRRIDYILWSTDGMDMITQANIVDGFQNPVESDHKAVEVRLPGLRVLRRMGKKFQRPQYKLEHVTPENMERVKLNIMETIREGHEGQEKLDRVLDTIRNSLREELGQRQSLIEVRTGYRETGSIKEKKKEMKLLRKEHNELVMGLRMEMSKEGMKVLRQMVGGESESGGKQGGAEMREAGRREEQSIEREKVRQRGKDIRMVRKGIEKVRKALKKEKLEEEEKQKRSYRARADLGQTYSKWSKHFCNQGKRWRSPSEEMAVLEDEYGKIYVEEEIMEVITRFTEEQWGKERQLGEIDKLGDKEGEEEAARIASQTLNKELGMDEVERAISKLKAEKAPGEDMIPNEIWKMLEKPGVRKLTEALEKCRQTSQFPERWRKTILRWIYKNKGKKTEVGNYRPIALSDTLYKIFARVLTERLEIFVERTGAVSVEQDGFRRDRGNHPTEDTSKKGEGREGAIPSGDVGH